MRIRLILASAIVAYVGFCTPAFAQSRAAEADLQRYIAHHPEVQRNPSLLSDPRYLSTHPAYAGFLDAHPSIRAQARSMGAWDKSYQWHDANWWHRNDPNWVYANRPEWNQANPAWMNDGDYDDTHEWRNRSWWVQNHPNWVREHHPGWERRAEANEEMHEHHGNAYGHYKNHDHDNRYHKDYGNKSGYGNGQGNGDGQGNGHHNGHGND